MTKLQITLARSPIGYEKSQGLTARALGLNKRGKTVVQPDNACIRGMIFKIRHLVEVEEIEVTDEPKEEAN
ncbi:MAG: 50S ribosomal protein L30 [Armatimonadaceae bacterium]